MPVYLDDDKMKVRMAKWQLLVYRRAADEGVTQTNPFVANEENVTLTLTFDANSSHEL